MADIDMREEGVTTLDPAADPMSFIEGVYRLAPVTNPLVIGAGKLRKFSYDTFHPGKPAPLSDGNEYVPIPATRGVGNMYSGMEFNPYEQPEIERSPRLARFLGHTESREEFEAELGAMREAEEIWEEVRAGLGEQDAELAGGFNEMFSPEFFVGVPAATAAMRVARVAVLSTGGAALGESLLRSADPSRDPSIAPVAVLSAMVSGTAIGMLGRNNRVLPEGPAVDTAVAVKTVDPPPAKMSDFIPNEAGELRVPGARGRKNAEDNPSMRSEFEKKLEDEGPVPTGVGAEKLRFNPVGRLINSGSPIARKFAEELVDMGGIIKNKNRRGVRTETSVETNYRINHMKELFDVVDGQNEAFLAYRGKTANTPGKRQIRAQASRFQDAITKTDKLTLKEFRQEIGKAMKNGDQHEIPEVAKAASSYRKMVERMGKEANDIGLFERALKREISGIESFLKAEAKENLTPEASARLAARRVKLQAKLDRLKKFGPDAGEGNTFFPRVYRQDKILADPEGFVRDIARGLRNENPSMSNRAALLAAREVQKNVSGIRPHLDIDAAARKGSGDASSARARMLDIDDRFLEKWVENDAEIVLRSYNKSIGTDIELMKQFGDPSLGEKITQITEEFDTQIKNASDPAEALRLQRDRDQTISDVQNLRDVVRGTFGASEDPFAATTKFTKAMKAFNVVTMLGGAAISSFSDVGRFAMTEGVRAGYGPILKSLSGETGKTLRAMSRADLMAAGEALDMVLGLRALQMADIGSSFGRLSKVERLAQEGANLFFMANGLNLWNNTMKEFAGIVVGNRILRDAIDLADGKLSSAATDKLTRSGIDEGMAGRIGKEWAENGENINGVFVANTADWNDAGAVAAYRAALSQDVNRTIVTPGAGDKAFWTSTEFGSLIAQFKSFAQASTNRVLVSGLQEADHNMAIGASILLGLGAVVNETKNLIAGRETSDSMGEVVEGAIDRSGLFGVFQEFNNIAEVVSGNRLGIGPLLTGQGPSPSPSEVAGTMFGPTGSTLATTARVAGDIVTGNADANTLRDAGRLVPGQNLPFVQGAKTLASGDFQPPFQPDEGAAEAAIGIGAAAVLAGGGAKGPTGLKVNPRSSFPTGSLPKSK